MTEMPIRTAKRFLPNLFKMFGFFIIVAMCSFFGCIELYQPAPPPSIPEESAGAEESDPFSELLARMMSFQNIDTDFTLDYTYAKSNITVSAEGNFVYDLGTNGISADIDLVYNEQIFDVAISYVAPDLFLTINGNTYLFDASQEMNLSGVLDFVASNLSINTDFIYEWGLKIGVDFKNFNVAELLAKLDVKTTEDKNTGDYAFNIKFGNVIVGRIVTDKNYSIKTIELEAGLEGHSIDLNADVNKMNSVDIYVDYEENGEEIDMSGLTTYAVYTENLFSNNDFVEGDIVVTVNDESYNAKLYYDNSETTKIKLVTKVEGIDLSVAYADDMIYLDVADLKISFAIADYDTWETTINSIVEKHTSKTVSEFIKEVVYQYIEIHFDNNDDEQEILKLVGAFFVRADDINQALPTQTTMTDSTFTMIWDNKLEVAMTKDFDQLTSFVATYSNIVAKVDFVVLDSGIDISGVYYDVTQFLPVSAIVDQILTSKQASGKIAVVYDDETIEATYTVDFTAEILAQFKITAFCENFEVFVSGQKLFAKIGEIVVEGDIGQLENYAAKIDEIFATNLSEGLVSVKENATQTTDVIAIVVEILKGLKISAEDGKVAVINYLSNVGAVALDENRAIIDFETETFKTNVEIEATNIQLALPTATDTVESLLEKIENTKAYIETNVYAFEFDVEYNKIALAGKAYIDLTNEVYVVENVTVGNNTLNVRYENNIGYIDYAGNKLQVSVENVEELATILMSIVSANTMTETEEEIDLTEVLTEIFGEDVTVLSVKDILKKIEAKLTGNLDGLRVNATFNTTNKVTAEILAEYRDQQLSHININLQDKVSADLNVIEYTLETVENSEYYKLGSAHTGEVTVTYDDLSLNVAVELDFTDRIFVKATTTVMDEEVEIIIENNMLYLTIGGIALSTDFNNAKELVEYIVEGFKLVLPESKDINIEEILETLDLNTINPLTGVEGLMWSVTGSTLTAKYETTEYTISGSLTDEATLEETPLPTETEDLKDAVAKALNVKEYIETGIFEFDFTADYNGFEFSGMLKMSNGVIEISNVYACGEYVNIRLQDNMLYFDYGNMKLKFDISSIGTSSGSGTGISMQEVLNQLTSDSLGVVIDFGVFEEIVNILKDYTLKDYYENIILNLTGSTNALNVTLGHKNDLTVSQIVSALINFKDNNITGASVEIYDIISADLTVRNTDASTIPEFDAEKYQDYSEDFVAGLLDSLEVQENVYAFSSDISIRYSNTNFYGDMVAMLVAERNEDGSLNRYIPYVSVYTTSLGLNSYIYMVDSTIYIDINGLLVYADLNETTVDEIITFAETTFGVSLEGEADALDATATAFKVILPALDKVYGCWIESGVQVDIDGSLWYSETSRLYDIVLQAFVQNYEEIVVPTAIVLGANIEDPNTTLYDDYTNYLLDCETSVTNKLNFAVYLNNVTVGKYVEGLNTIFVSDTNSYNSITGLKSNYGATKLTEFNPYQTVLDMVDTVYSFVMGLEYQANVSVNIAGADSNTNIGGDVVVKLNELTDEEIANNTFVLFGNKSMKVQGDLDISTNTARHLVDILYESANNAALYASYSHDNYAPDKTGVDNTNDNHIQRGNQFNVKINNTSLSDIISMLVAFADVDIGEDLTNSLSLKPNTTDFEYLQSLLGIGAQDVGDDISKVDQILSSVETMTAMLNNIKLEKAQMSDGLYQTTLTIKIDMANVNGSASAQIGTVQLVLKQENSTDNSGNAVVVTKLRQISVVNLIYGANTINATINLEDYSDSSFDYLTRYPDNVHFDFSSLDDFVDIAVSTINTQNFNFTGTADIFIEGLSDLIGVFSDSGSLISVNYDLFASIDDKGELYFYLELDVPSFCDVTYNAGGFGETYTVYSSYGFNNRISILEYKNGVLDITQNTYGNNNVWYNAWKENDNIDAHPEATFTSEEIGPNIMKILAYALGLTDSVYDMIKDLVDTMNPYPSLEETLLSFTTLSSEYQMGVDGQSLTGDDAFNDMNITLGLSGAYSANNRTYKFIDSVDTTLDIGGVLKIPVNLRSVSGTSYKTGYGKTLYTNDYYRKRYLSKYSA